MTAANAITPPNAIDKIFGVLAEPSTYKRLLFLVVGFPLGIFYFASMTPLLAVGVGLTPIVVGIGILAIALWIVSLYAVLER
ncbi:MAG: sensor domain-containing protein, partial [Bryobacteraceae bacterium]